MIMPAKHQPAGAFSGKKLTKAPGAGAHPLAPKKTAAPAAESSKLTQFSARLDPELLRQVKIAVATSGTTLQAATAEAFELWLDQKRS
ncbi:hypothetical protein GS894_24205 [Rhodococcus hoagii]|nr:hypothetical protein [Prescottella equi]NKS05228.1 hypothetical protein [Prescottella equi]NKS86991.1 hypothetical protein [Prescottella equi]NKS92677.1 hypothetical protein [Prescottella equi]NKS92688.1 hypothetical protein [Prescottella equi]